MTKPPKNICNKRHNKWCKDLHDSGEGSCIHSKPHICCIESSYCETIGKKVKCKEWEEL